MDTTLEKDLPPQPQMEQHHNAGFGETARSFVSYLKSPQHLAPSHIPAAKIWQPFLQLALLNISICLAVAGLFFGIFELLGYKEPTGSNKIEQLFKSLPAIVSFLVLTVAAPLAEEFMFRYPLRFTKGRAFLLFMVLSLVCLPPLLQKLGISSLISICIVLVAMAMTISFALSQKWQQKAHKFWIKRFTVVFYGVASLFAIVHLLNYNSLHVPALLAPLLVLPQFIGGLFWGYFRMRYNIWWSILGHGLYNALFYALALLT
ncbi:CPBP family glutamic-type intramembrane protease [Pontibacter harenae]|uniref:CPBP family glutamic-type intramembrane protease n=1 Tax=Pontibacter harenae TaxID=2894083 RepID=UPI001E3F7540|nr:CPBP family glutamic-type intramembrane protease [Pontibacter harenae]MCC9166938.1 CPBP family glutamic-type intramembrane protease [Pontibacter harenae]